MATYGTGAQFDEAAARRRIVAADPNGSPTVVVTDPEDTKKELKAVSSRQGKKPPLSLLRLTKTLCSRDKLEM